MLLGPGVRTGKGSFTSGTQGGSTFKTLVDVYTDREGTLRGEGGSPSFIWTRKRDYRDFHITPKKCERYL